MNRRTHTNSKVRKTHYDQKHAISLEVDASFESNASDALAMAKAVEDDFTVDVRQDHSYTDAFEVNTEGFQDDEVDFSTGYSGGEVMAKAYELEVDDVNETQISMAKAYDDHVPADQDNKYSDVFEASEEDIFQDFDKQVSEAKQSDLPVADEMDDDDKLARELQAVLSGQKSLANLAEFSDGMQQAPQRSNAPSNPNSDSETEREEKVKAIEKKMESNEAIFDQLATDQKNLTTYQLGEVKLSSIFEEADAQMGRSSVALAKDRLNDMVDENSMAMDGMEWAEDFELMDSIAEEEKQSEEPNTQKEAQPSETRPTEAQSTSDSDIKDAVIEEEITVNPNDNTVTE